MKQILFLGALLVAEPAAAQSIKTDNVQAAIIYNGRNMSHVEFQTAYDNRIVLEKMLKRPGDSYRAAMETGACIVAKDQSHARTLIEEPTRPHATYAALYKALSGGKYRNCAGSAAGLPMDLVNGALAEAVLGVQSRVLEDRALIVDVTAAERFYATATPPTLDTVARCLAVYSPGLAARVLSTKIGSPSERTAVSQLFAATPECGLASPPANIAVDDMRSAVATGLFHWLNRH